jgi:hypothetical protein
MKTLTGQQCSGTSFPRRRSVRACLDHFAPATDGVWRWQFFHAWRGWLQIKIPVPGGHKMQPGKTLDEAASSRENILVAIRRAAVRI